MANAAPLIDADMTTVTMIPKILRNRLRNLLMRSSGMLDRVIMDQVTERWVEELDYKNMSAVEISGRGWKDFGFGEYSALAYPHFDICAKTEIEAKFDIVLAEQVFEHLKYPYRAGKNVFSLLKPGGYALISVPFLQKIHNFPIDCSRWTEVGLRYFLEECGFHAANIRTASWGNRSAVRATLKSATSFPVYNRFLHSLENEPAFPVQVWALARRSNESPLQAR